MSIQTILAARRVVPPDLMAPADLSKISKNEIRPELVPPEFKFSYLLLKVEKFVPDPEPYLKSFASVLTKSKIDSKESSTD